MLDKVKFSTRGASGGTSTSSADSPHSLSSISETGEWKERRDAEQALFTYLSEMPTTIAVLHGPQGSGKSKMVASILSRTGDLTSSAGQPADPPRRILTIDCAEIGKTGSDSGVVSALARQTGYWPVFSFLSSMNNLIDLASMGLIGQKAGFSTTVDEQMKEILEVVGGALKQVRCLVPVTSVAGALIIIWELSGLGRCC